MPLRDRSTRNPVIRRFEMDSSKNAHDKADPEAPNPTDAFPNYDLSLDVNKHVGDDTDY